MAQPGFDRTSGTPVDVIELANFKKSPGTWDDTVSYCVKNHDSDGTDHDAYLAESLPSKHEIRAQHSHIYIDGDMEEGASINMRTGFVSARALKPKASITGSGLAVVISNGALSTQSDIFRKTNLLTIVVPEEHRAAIFDECCTHSHKYPVLDSRALLTHLQTRFPDMPIRFLIRGEYIGGSRAPIGSGIE